MINRSNVITPILLLFIAVSSASFAGQRDESIERTPFPSGPEPTEPGLDVLDWQHVPAPDDDLWSDLFGQHSVNGIVWSACVYNGDLILGGDFSWAGGKPAKGLARWDGQTWSEFGGGVDVAIGYACVHDMKVFRGDLIIGGDFEVVGTDSIPNIARWDGTAWHSLGSGLGLEVYAFVEYDSTLIATGTFRLAGDLEVNGIASWDGSAWSPMGTGLGGSGRSLTVFEDELIVGGWFTEAGGVRANRVACWSGTSWDSLGGGFNGGVQSLAPYAGYLFAGGGFDRADGDYAHGLARWDGTSWHKVGRMWRHYSLGAVHSMLVHDGSLFIGGDFWTADDMTVNGIVAFRNWAFDNLGAGLHGTSFQRGATLVEYDGKLVVGGRFHLAGDKPANHVALWDGVAWNNIGAGEGLESYVRSLEVYDGQLVGAGFFQWAGEGANSYAIAVWNGNRWESFPGGGVLRYYGNERINALAIYDGKLAAGGLFTEIGGAAARSIAVWDRESWSSVKADFDDEVFALAAYDGDLIAGGRFDRTNSDNKPFPGIARWDGVSWAPLGSGFNRPVRALTGFNGELIAGGEFTMSGDDSVAHIARWNGSAWLPLGSGLDERVLSLVIHNGDLYVGGFFSTAGGEPARGLARWDGVSWDNLGQPLDNPVNALYSYGNHLYVGGSFSTANGTEARKIAAWDGEIWRGFGSGFNTVPWDFAVFQDQLHVGGLFWEAGGKPSFYMARWEEMLEPVPVKLTAFSVERLSDSAILRWQSAGSTSDFAGFHVYRENSVAERERLTHKLLAGQTEYEFIDESPPKERAEYWLAEISRTGETTWHGPAVLPPASLPVRLVLSPPAPNPFTSETHVTYSLTNPQHVSLTIYDLRGRWVATLVDKDQGTGEYTVSWDGNQAASGLYFLRLQAGEVTKTQKLMVLR